MPEGGREVVHADSPRLARGALGRPWWRAGTVCLLLAAVLAPLSLSGCVATKRDVRTLRDEVRWTRERQDSALARIATLARAALDSLVQLREDQVRMRGDMGRQLLALEEQLLQIQELTGQSQRRLAELRDQLESRARTIVVGPAEGQDTGAAGARAGTQPPAVMRGVTDAETAYNAAMTQFQRGSIATARRGLQDFLKLFPKHNLAPHAQFILAETYEREKRVEEAIQEFLRIPELYPTSDRVPDALYRVGLLELEQRGNRAAARRYFQRVVNSYPQSGAAELAKEKLAEIRP